MCCVHGACMQWMRCRDVSWYTVLWVYLVMTSSCLVMNEWDRPAWKCAPMTCTPSELLLYSLSASAGVWSPLIHILNIHISIDRLISKSNWYTFIPTSTLTVVTFSVFNRFLFNKHCVIGILSSKMSTYQHVRLLSLLKVCLDGSVWIHSIQKKNAIGVISQNSCYFSAIPPFLIPPCQNVDHATVRLARVCIVHMLELEACIYVCVSVCMLPADCKLVYIM